MAIGETAAERMRRPDPDPTIATMALIKTSTDALKDSVTARFESMDRAQVLFHEDLTRVPTSLDKAIGTLREYIEARLERLTAVDDHSTAQRELIIVHLNENLRKATETIQTEISGDKQFYLEKFEAVQETIRVLKDTINDRFTQNDQNTEKAFNAAKQAVSERDASNMQTANKSERNLMDLIGKLDDNVKTLSATTSTQIASNKSNTDDKVNDLKDLIARLDNRISSGESSKKGSGESVIWLFGGLSAIGTIAGIIALVFTLAHHP